MPAPKGNQNAAKGAEWAGALRKALDQYVDEVRGIERGNALYAIAEGVVRDAIEGNPFARQEIANRLDGKPKERVEVEQTINVNVGDAESLEAAIRSKHPRSTVSAIRETTH